MDSKEQVIIQEIESEKNQSKIRTQFFVVSNNCDKLKVHTDSSLLKEQTWEDLINSEPDLVNGQNLSTIVAINQIAWCLTIFEVNKLAFTSLESDTNESFQKFNQFKKAVDLKSKEDEEKYEYEILMD